MDLVVLDVRERSTVTDWIVVASGMSKPHIKALYEDVLVRLKHEGMPSYRHNGEVDGGWVVLDYVHVVVHLFTAEVREFYQIEDLWKQEVPGEKPTPIRDNVVAPGAFPEDEQATSEKVSSGKNASSRKKTSSRPSAKKVFEGVSQRVAKSASAKRPPRRKPKA